KQEIATDAGTADRRQRLRAEHQKADNNNGPADEALDGPLVMKNQRGEEQPGECRASRLDRGAMAKRHKNKAAVGDQRLRWPRLDAHHKAAGPRQRRQRATHNADDHRRSMHLVGRGHAIRGFNAGRVTLIWLIL
ncbi:MAG: hypothetical protein WA716_05355, partial [Pseudolabrys sp.]